jgi:hypothetical protein
MQCYAFEEKERETEERKDRESEAFVGEEEKREYIQRCL